MSYHAIMDMFPNHSKWNFLNEKYIMNGDTHPKKVCANPLTGYVNTIPVSGDFRDAHNIFAVVSGSPTKKSSITYHIPKANSITEFWSWIMLKSTWPVRLSVLSITFGIPQLTVGLFMKRLCTSLHDVLNSTLLNSCFIYCLLSSSSSSCSCRVRIKENPGDTLPLVPFRNGPFLFEPELLDL
jgi:hypothetical protein